MLRASLLSFASVACAFGAQPVVATAQYDNSRTGANLLETRLTPQNVNTGRFGRSFAMFVTGDVNARPLYVPSLAVAGKGSTMSCSWPRSMTISMHLTLPDNRGNRSGACTSQVLIEGLNRLT